VQEGTFYLSLFWGHHDVAGGEYSGIFGMEERSTAPAGVDAKRIVVLVDPTDAENYPSNLRDVRAAAGGSNSRA
jgi:hypothetical protein